MHHGYQWLEPQDFVLTGIVRSFFYGNPHITLRVLSGTEVWLAESTDVIGAQLVGFMADSLKVGDTATVYGYRSRDRDHRVMRADRIEVAGRTYVLFPRSIFGPPFGGG